MNNDLNPPMILLVGGTDGEQLLLTEAFQEYSYDVKINVIYDTEEALSYLKIRATRLDFPPPHAIVIRAPMTGVAGCALLKYIKEVEWLADIPHFVLIHHRMITITSCPSLVESCYINEPEKWVQYASLVKIIINAINGKWKTNFQFIQKD